MNGRIGVPALCTLISHLKSGVSGFKLIKLPLFSLSIGSLQLFMVLLKSFWNFVIKFPFISSAPSFEIKFETFCSYSFW